jgi:hypothetical protein
LIGRGRGKGGGGFIIHHNLSRMTMYINFYESITIFVNHTMKKNYLNILVYNHIAQNNLLQEGRIQMKRGGGKRETRFCE